jgi:hypothetical protein
VRTIGTRDRVGDADLADVMEQRADLHATKLVVRELELLADRAREG